MPNAPSRKLCSEPCREAHIADYAESYRMDNPEKFNNPGHKAHAQCEYCGKKYRKDSAAKTCSTECRDMRATVVIQERYDKRAKEMGRKSRTRRGRGVVDAVCALCGSRFTTANRRFILCSDQCRIINGGGARLKKYLRRKKLVIAVRAARGRKAA